MTKAAEDAGIHLREIDGFASYSMDRNDPTRLAAALGCNEIAFSNMVWGGGGGGCAAAVGNAAAAIVAGYAKYAVAYRGLAQGQFGRFGQARSSGGYLPAPMSYTAPYGLFSPAQHIALRTRTFMHQYGISQDPLAAIALASYAHAQRNPRAVMYGRPLTREDYDNSRWIAEPFHLFDCCQENDGAAAVILTSRERARDLAQRPAFVMAAAQGSETGYSLIAPTAVSFGSANFPGVARRLYESAGIGPADVDVAQVYENFTGGTLMSMVEHGLCAPEEVEMFCTEENLTAPHGKMPLNTSGGNLAECYMHGLELITEAARQIRGESTAQVPGAQVALVAAGPVTAPVSSLLLSTEP
ncbi:MAG: thiolase C-terminal domain-containing protein [Tepidiformaceae bacterium]